MYVCVHVRVCALYMCVFLFVQLFIQKKMDFVRIAVKAAAFDVERYENTL